MSQKKEIKENKKRLFSKALFKQSCKANGAMWAIITVAVCFMLACVMLISGTSSVSSVKEGIQDTIIEKTIESSVKKSGVDLYQTTDDAEEIFDKAFAEKINELNTKANYKKISAVTTAATDEATDLVTDYVTPLVEAEVKDRLTPKATAYVTEKATAKVTELITAEIFKKVLPAMYSTQAQATIANNLKTMSATDAVKAAIASYTKTYTETETAAVQPAIAELKAGAPKSDLAVNAYNYGITEANKAVASGDLVNPHDATLSQEDAATALTAYKKYVSDSATAYITSYVSKKVGQDLLANVFSTEAATKITEMTDATNPVDMETAISDVTSFYTALYTAQVNTSTHQKEVTNQVLAQYKDTWIDEATEKYKDDVVEEVKDDKLDKYTADAKEALDSQITKIEDKATDKVTDIITETYIKPAYEYAVDAVEAAYPEDEDESAYGAAMVAINPDNQVDDQYTDNNEAIPEEYITAFTDYLKDDIMAWADGKATTTLSDYINSDERATFRHERAYNAVSMLIGANITSDDSKQEILDKLADYKVSEEKYDSFGFDYDKCKTLAYEACSTYQNDIDFEVSKLSDDVKNNETLYQTKLQEIKEDAYSATSGSFLDSLPQDVTDGLEELGTMDLYGLIVGSIFFKMAGLLLPIIYVIMCSNNLIASQVDTGSMAYVLSTSTRRKEVTFTQALYLIGSIVLMFICTGITSIICFNLVDVNTDLTIQKLILINIGACVTMFAISGINFLASCVFDRSKRAMALGGGISIFFLVATMLGLFGSPVIPSVVRITALNNFNYVSLISLFDVVSILDETDAWILKMVILVIVGLVGYIAGSIHFKKKDLPL